MIPQLANALSNGFTTKQVIDYLIKKFPQHSDKIKSAMAAGFSADQIVKFLSGGAKALNSEENIGTEHEQTRGIDIKQREKINKTALAGAGLAAGALAAPMAATALKHAIPNTLSGLLPQSNQLLNPSGTPNNTNPQQPPVPGVNPPVESNNIPQQQPQVQPEVKTIDVGSLLEKSGLKKHVDELAGRTKDPKAIAGILYSKFPKEMKDFQSASGKNMEDAIGDYLGENPAQSGANMAQPPEIPSKNDEIPLEHEKKSPKIEKSSIVASPNGIGEIKAIRNGEAIIDVDGKLTKVDVDDLEKEPEDVVETVQQLLQIPEVDRSSIVSLFTYDPNDKEMYIQFHNGETYKYLDVDPEKVFKIANKMGIPITQGKNIFGAWSPEDKKSLGATLIKEIINDPKYKKTKHGEEANPNYRQLETLYDYWEKLRKKPKRKRL